MLQIENLIDDLRNRRLKLFIQAKKIWSLVSEHRLLETEIAVRIDRSQPWVSQRIGLWFLYQNCKDVIGEKEMELFINERTTIAIRIQEKIDESIQYQFVQAVVSKNLKEWQLIELIREMKKHQKNKKRKLEEAILLPVYLKEFFGT